MQSPRLAHSGRPHAVDPTPSRPAHKRALLAGVALAGASVVAVSPTSTAVPALLAIQSADLALTASANPLETWQSVFQTSATHIEYGFDEIANSYPLYTQWMSAGASGLIEELAGSLLNGAGWQALAGNLPDYGKRIQDAIQTSIEGSQNGWEGPNGEIVGGSEAMGKALEKAISHLQAGEFNYALATINEQFLWSLGAAGWPLQDVLNVPGDILTDLGADQAAFVVNHMLNDTMTKATMALIGPSVTAAFRFTESLDAVVAASKTGDWETAAAELLDLPAKTVGAYLNGYTPKVAIENNQPWDWPGLLTKDGTVEYFMFTIPRELSWAIGGPRIPAPTSLTEAPAQESAEQTVPEGTDGDSSAPAIDSDAGAVTISTLAKKVKAAIAGATENNTQAENTASVSESTGAEAAVVDASPADIEASQIKAVSQTEDAAEAGSASDASAAPSTTETKKRGPLTTIRGKLADRFGKHSAATADSESTATQPNRADRRKNVASAAGTSSEDNSSDSAASASTGSDSSAPKRFSDRAKRVGSSSDGAGLSRSTSKPSSETSSRSSSSTDASSTSASSSSSSSD